LEGARHDTTLLRKSGLRQYLDNKASSFDGM
jgi:hypothetical protein